MPVAVVEAPLPIVDGLTLSPRHRELLNPGGLLVGRDGETHRLPRYFYEIESWDRALATPLSAHFGLWEFIDVDVREPGGLRAFPRYVPCAVSLLASALESFRMEVGAPVRIMANGGYRSPSHAISTGGSPHGWGTAADIYKVGGEFLDTPARIERYGVVLRRVLPFSRIRPTGDAIAATDDHLHVDLGYVTVVPRGASERDDETQV
jgi:hypothetical protein